MCAKERRRRGEERGEGCKCSRDEWASCLSSLVLAALWPRIKICPVGLICVWKDRRRTEGQSREHVYMCQRGREGR